MHKLLALINWAGKTDKQEELDLEDLEIPIIVNTPQSSQKHGDTRPTYRIGKHDPADINRAIDLAG